MCICKCVSVIYTSMILYPIWVGSAISPSLKHVQSRLNGYCTFVSIVSSYFIWKEKPSLRRLPGSCANFHHLMPQLPLLLSVFLCQTDFLTDFLSWHFLTAIFNHFSVMQRRYGKKKARQCVCVGQQPTTMLQHAIYIEIAKLLSTVRAMWTAWFKVTVVSNHNLTSTASSQHKHPESKWSASGRECAVSAGCRYFVLKLHMSSCPSAHRFSLYPSGKERIKPSIHSQDIKN